MGYWVFMFVIDLLLPVTMIGLGIYFSKHAPKEINPLFGYRTEMSMKNEQTWQFANHYFGKISYHFGWSAGFNYPSQYFLCCRPSVKTQRLSVLPV